MNISVTSIIAHIASLRCPFERSWFADLSNCPDDLAAGCLAADLSSLRVRLRSVASAAARSLMGVVPAVFDAVFPDTLAHILRAADEMEAKVSSG